MQVQERRREVLGFFYKHQHLSDYHNPYRGLPAEEWAEIAVICRYLRDKGYIEWNGSFRPDLSEVGRITARGVDHFEGTDKPMPNTIINNSQGVVIGNGNTVNVGDVTQRVMTAIDASNGSLEEKAEAKSLWSKLTNNQTIASIVGAIAGATLSAGKAS